MTKRAGIIITLLLGSLSMSHAVENSAVNLDTAASVEERRILVSIQDQYDRLEQREAEINSRELQLKTLQEEVDKKLAELTKKREELTEKQVAISKLLDDVRNVEDERVGELSLIYEKMNPQKAALLIRDLDEDLAVKLLLGLKKKIAGKILDNLDAGTATALSKAFTELPVPE